MRLLDPGNPPRSVSPQHPLAVSRTRERTGDVFFAGVLAAVVFYGAWQALRYVHHTTGLGEFGYAFALGTATLAPRMRGADRRRHRRVGAHRGVDRDEPAGHQVRPVEAVQVLASFPANFVFPLATLVFVAWHIPIDISAVLLMALGAQWYILFNVIIKRLGHPPRTCARR